MNKNCGISEESRFRMQLQVSEGKGLPEDAMREMAKFKFARPTELCSLKHVFKTTTVFFKKCFPESSPISHEAGLNYNHVEEG